MSYWDTSALVKLFTTESDSQLFHSHLRRTGGALVTSEFARMEFWSAVCRKQSDGVLRSGGAKQALADFDLGAVQNYWRFIPVSSPVRARFERIVEQCYSQIPPILVRTLDALHIAAASTAGATEIVATDRRLRDAATLLGFQLFPPPTP